MEISAKRQSIRVAIVDDQTLVREGMRMILSQQQDIEVTGEGDDGFAALRIAQGSLADILLIEPTLPRKGGIETIRQIATARKYPRVVVVTRIPSVHFALRTLRAGAAGYLRKESSAAELISAVRNVYLGRRYVPDDLRDLVLTRLHQPALGGETLEVLSDRELQVLFLLASGFTNREIAAKLLISVKTVDTHRGNILRKLGLRNNSDLTRFAIEDGLLNSA